MRWSIAGVFLLLMSACATSFTGEPKVPNGPAGCKQVCTNWGMELSGMIAMGEYSDGCICQLPGKQVTPAAAAAAAGPPAAGVVMQMQEEQQRQASMHH